MNGANGQMRSFGEKKKRWCEGERGRVTKETRKLVSYEKKRGRQNDGNEL